MRKMLLLLAFAGLPIAVMAPEAPPQQQIALIYEIKKQIFTEGIYKRSLTPELLMEALCYLDVKEPEIVYKQAIIETGWFTSDLCVIANNLFGMRLPKSRPTKAIGEYNHHAMYDHWYDSVIDYKLWQDYYIEKGYILTEYYSFLQEVGYATDRFYITKLKSVLDIT